MRKKGNLGNYEFNQNLFNIKSEMLRIKAFYMPNPMASFKVKVFELSQNMQKISLKLKWPINSTKLTLQVEVLISDDI